MARKKKESAAPRTDRSKVFGLRPEVVEQPITETLEVNYMPYAMSVIVSRAIPEIDGFKPSHRKLLYTMYQMKLLGGARTKSANVVGATMKLNPHGDAAIYETMVRLSRGYGALLHPLVDSKGNFGKVYSRDMAYAASRYTEVRLAEICREIFRDIDQDTVDFVPNYDGTLQEPTLLPTRFPNILVSANQGIAVGMASNLCGFNLAEVCDAAIATIKNPEADLLPILLAPDLPTGGEIIYRREELEEIYRRGRGSFRLRARWKHIAKENLIEIYEIPYTTTAEAIIAKVAELVKAGRLREVADMRDETDLSGLKLTIDLKRGVDAASLMHKLFGMTPLMETFSCNFNVLVEGMPQVMGVYEILARWIDWRIRCVKRQTAFAIRQKEERLHLLYGLRSILLDIDRAIAIIRETEAESQVVPRLMEGFEIDEIQAEYVAEIRLRNINKEYILKRLSDVETLEAEIADLRDLLQKPRRIQAQIIKQLEAVKKQYGIPRKTGIVEPETLALEREELQAEAPPPATPVHVFLSREGYLKKISPQSLRMSGEQKYKEGDGPYESWELQSDEELLLFTDRQHCYKVQLDTLEDSKASLLGDYLPAKLPMEEGEQLVWACPADAYRGSLLFFFENGKAARVAAAAYQTVTKRRRLTGAYSDKSPLVSVLRLYEETEAVLRSSEGRALIVKTEQIPARSSRNTQGISVMTLRPKYKLSAVNPLREGEFVSPARYRARNLPAAGAILKGEDRGERQLSLDEL